jgi:hypothetical protein
LSWMRTKEPFLRDSIALEIMSEMSFTCGEDLTGENKYWDVTQKWVDLVWIYSEKPHTE